ncbi:MAG: hypothetical protein PHU46_12270 [Rhodocyclaceae bacterium]|nr:hypothetical protein [Rhodocyclaceae bacterium]
MQAIELEATIDSRHEIHVNLPDSVPVGKARLLLLFEGVASQKQERVFGQFQGKGQVPADFDEPLPETFWTGESR